MAISQGVRQHRVWLTLQGVDYPILSAEVEQQKTKKSATFHGIVPMKTPGLMDIITTLGDNDASIKVQSDQTIKSLVDGMLDDTTFDYNAGTIAFSGRCKSAKLHETKSAEKWNNRKHSEIVQDLASRCGLNCQMDSDTLQAGRFVEIDFAHITDGISYASVIHKIAEIEGMRWYVNSGTLYMVADSDSAATYPITVNQDSMLVMDAVRLSINRNIPAGKNVSVNVKSWHPGKKQMYSGTSTYGGAGGTTSYGYHLPAATQDHVDKHARSKAKEHARHELTVSVECAGDVTIDVSQKLRLRGTTYFDQDYEMDCIHHHAGHGGHTMSISAKAPKDSRSQS